MSHRLVQLAVLVSSLVSGCLQSPLTTPLGSVDLPGQKQFRVGAIVYHSDADVPAQHPLFTELATFPEQVYRTLELPVRDRLIHVYLFHDRDSYDRYVAQQFADLPPRRALFVLRRGQSLAADEELQILAYWGDRIQDDLRHELTHAVLHGVLTDIPLWLDEGLAMYFECGISARGKHTRALQALAHELDPGPWRLDLPRLEAVKNLKDLRLADYHESWAWVHFLLHHDPATRRVLLDHLRASPSPQALSDRLQSQCPSLNDTLHAHIKKLLAERTIWPQ